MPVAQLPNASTRAREAETSLDSVREAFDLTGKKFWGKNFVSEEVRQSINDFIGTDPVAQTQIRLHKKNLPGKELPSSVLTKLLERFEEYCRRCGACIPEETKVFAYRIMVSRLYRAARALEIAPDKIINAVVQHPDIHRLASSPEFKEFAGSPGIFRTAVQNHTSDPKSFLRRVQSISQDILSDPEFAQLHDTPSIVSRAAISNPGDTREFLRTGLRRIQEIISDPEFSFFTDMPGFLKRAVFDRPTDPKEWLRSIQATTERILQDPAFSDLADTPGCVLTVVSNYKKPEAFLKRALRTTQMLLLEPEFAEFRDTPYIIKLAAMRVSGDPRAFLRDVSARCRALFANPEFAEFLSSPGVVRRAAANSTASPEDYLRKVKMNIEALSVDPEFADLARTPGIIRHAASNHSSNPAVYLRRLKAIARELHVSPDFAEFADIGFIIRRAADSKSSDQFLSGVKAGRSSIMEDPEFQAIKDDLTLITVAVVFHSSDPRAFIRRYMEKQKKILANPEFFNHSGYQIRRAIIGYKDPEQYLRGRTIEHSGLLTTER